MAAIEYRQHVEAIQENNTVIPGPELARAGLGANKDGFSRINRERLLPRVPGADIDGHVVAESSGAVAAFETLASTEV